MKVSIIIPAYNCESYIQRTIDSVQNQTYPKELLEVIIVNDGSTDNTAEIINRYQNNFKIIHTENKGVSHARNIGLANSTGEYIQYLDSDDLLAPNKIEVQVKALLENNADVAYGNWQRFEEIENKIILKEKVERKIKGDKEVALFTDFWCPPAAILYSRDIVNKIGPWKQWLPIIQDARYFLDAAIQGAKFVYTNELAALYREGNSNSLSKREKDFVTDCFKNAKDVYATWNNQEKLSSSQKEAIISCLRYCINSFRKLDKQLFIDSIDFLLKINPGYMPSDSGGLKFFSKILGYKNAEKLARFKTLILK